jgi:hypothetical protein
VLPDSLNARTAPVVDETTPPNPEPVMARNPLESLLLRIRDDVASADDIARARELVRSDERLPDELKEVVDFTDDAAGDAAGLLAVLGADSLFSDALREGLARELSADAEPEVTAAMVDAPWAWSEALVAAVRMEAGEIELSDAVVQVIGGPERFALAAAVRAEAGEVELANGVLACLGLREPGLPLAAAIAGEAGPIDVLAAVEGALTDLHLPLAAAVAAEAGPVELADAVLSAIGAEARIPLADAVRAEAGTVELWAVIEPVVSDAWLSALLDHELNPAAHRAAVRRLQEDPASGAVMTAFASIGGELRSAVRKEAGDTPYVWAAVAESLGFDAEQVDGWDGAVFAEAVRAHAGPVAVADAVMKRVTVRLPNAVVELQSMPAPANHRARWNVGAVLMALAAAALLVLLPGAPHVTGGTPIAAPTEVAGPPTQFASADEIVVEALDYGELANVTQATGDAGALILWVDEGVTL